MSETVSIEPSVMEKEQASVERAYTVFSLIVGKEARRARFLLDTKKSFNLADQYFDPGRGRLSARGREHTKYIFAQILEMYGKSHTASDMLGILKQTYTLVREKTDDSRENKTLQLIMASLRGHVLLHQNSFRTEQQRQQPIEDKSISLIPKAMQRVLRTALLGVFLFGFGHTQEVSYAEENKPSVTSLVTPEPLQANEESLDILDKAPKAFKPSTAPIEKVGQIKEKLQQQKELPVPDDNLDVSVRSMAPGESKNTTWHPRSDDESDFETVSVNWTERIHQRELEQDGQQVPPEVSTSRSLDVTGYQASTTEEAIEVAQRINFFPQDNYEHPSNMCGPLSADILYRNGILTDEMYTNGFSVADFWLAHPARLRVLFPESHFDFFDHIDKGETIGDFDFSQFPLEIGDFLYLIGGGFDHMLVITRVEQDDQGYRAYAMTNLSTSDGFVVEERLVFDSQNPEAGLFNEFTTPNNTIGMTGIRGFLLIRPKQIATPSE